MAASRSILIAAGLGALVVGTCAVSGVSLIPARLALGPCLKDWTSQVSYRPRVSPLASERFRVGDARVEVCYGRPAMHGRAIFGHLVPWDSLWRLGANEPTRLYLDRPISLGGVLLPAGRYSLYAAPTPGSWTVFVSRSILHWGNDISPAVRSREIGHVEVPIQDLVNPVETLTIAPDSAKNATRLVVEWERSRAVIPLAPGSQTRGQ
jgi:hypothetical protein